MHAESSRKRRKGAGIARGGPAMGKNGLRGKGSGVITRARERGCSSVVERHLAKVDVESSNLFTRSIHARADGGPGPVVILWREWVAIR